MKWTKNVVSILCLICVLTTGYIAESSGQVIIEVPNLARNLPTSWRPTAGSSLSFNVKVTRPTHYSGGRLTATLSEVTDYLGECGNRMSLYNDLELRQDSLHNSGWRVETAKVSLSHPIKRNKTDNVKTQWITLRVDCADYAAYGKLTFATTGSSIAEAAPVEITIPVDANGNQIADSWRNDGTKNYVASWDGESGPPAPNIQTGDGLAVLDEYRGLYTNGTWTDTDPEGWDVFIWSESAGGSPSYMSFHSMSSSEVDYESGVVHDFKIVDTPPHGMVYAIRLKNNPVAFDEKNPDRRAGNMGTGPPSSGTKGEIFTERIRGAVRLYQIAGLTEGVLLDCTVIHETGHGVSLGHCPNHNDLNCYMWAQGDAVHYATQYHSHHLVDYDLKIPAFGPQTPAAIPAGKKRTYDPETGTWSLEKDSSGSALLTPSGGSYAATVGDTHTAELTLIEAPSYIFWYVQEPGGSSPGPLMRQDTSGSLTSQLSYTFNSGAGNYVFSVSGTLASSGGAITKKYTVAVSTSTPTPAPPAAPPAPAPTPASVSLAPSSYSPTYYTATEGDNHNATLTLGAAPSSVIWYVQEPGQASPRSIITDNSGSLTSDFSYWFPTGVIGDYVISVSGTWASGGDAITASYTVWVGSPPPDSNDDDLTHYCPWCGERYNPNNNNSGACSVSGFHAGFPDPEPE